MHSSRLRRAVGTALAITTAALVGLTTPTTAAASPTLSSGDAGATVDQAPASEPGVRDLCPDPEPGHLACLSKARTDIEPQVGLAPNADPAGYGPADLVDAYDLPSGTAGEGITVAIVDAYDNPNAEADLAEYREQFGLPPCTTDNGCFRKLDQRGGTDIPPPPPAQEFGWVGEIALDVDMVSAVCPLCDILLIEGDSSSFDDLGTAVNTAVELGADYVSNSYGTRNGEDPSQVDFDHYYDHPGVGIVVSSGDAGFVTEWPASSPAVTAVGGTSLVPDDNARGWTEEAWSGAGSGCSRFEPKPDFQHDTECSARTVADVAAVADPQTGVAVYNTYGSGGWVVFGGTSAAAPIIAGTYALAGAPGGGQYPNTYPYATPDGLNDVVGGRNGSCGGSYLCTAVAGYDGPTGLGTPNGVASFAEPGDHGELVGTVTDAATGAPIADARVSTGDLTTTTDANGRYDISAEVGTYDVTAQAFGYAAETVEGVGVQIGGTTTVDFTLDPTDSATISGTVTDGSGHGWPLHARITVAGADIEPVWTDPFTGRYEISLPAGTAYTLRVSPDIPGYLVRDVDVTLTGDVNRNIAMKADASDCAAPGYRPANGTGTTESFDSPDTPDGWTVTDNNGTGKVWVFTDQRGQGNLTGGEGGFAQVNSDVGGIGPTPDSTLISPSIDMSDMADPAVVFRTNYRAFPGASADVDYSADGGATWTTVWEATDTDVPASERAVMLPGAAGQPDVRVRFHFVGGLFWWWQLDDIFLGERTCVPEHGGLIAGHVTDRNTGDPMNRVSVTSGDQPEDTGTTGTSEDPAMGDGYYWMFSSLTGARPFTASTDGFTDAARTVTVGANWTTRADFAMGAGHLIISADAITSEQRMGTTTTRTVDVTNDGTEPVEVSIGEHDSGVDALLAPTGAPVRRVSGEFSRDQYTAGTAPAGDGELVPADPPWTEMGDYPTGIMDNTVVTAGDGTVYSFGGTVAGNGPTAASFAYDPVAQAWSALPAMPHPRQKAAAAEYQGRIYVMSGWAPNNEGAAVTDVYDPRTHTWSSTDALAPAPMGASGVARLGDTMYLVGGCLDECDSSVAYSYDLGTDTWAPIADYPEAVSWESCGGIGDAVYCAGGGGTTGTYRYDPDQNEWTRVADLPVELWGSSYASANGMLLISGGVTNDSTEITNEGYAYDPGTNEWSALPNSANVVYRAGGACGFYKIGGSTSSNFTTVTSGELLPGFDQCAVNSDVPWLAMDRTEFTLDPGQSVTVTVTLDATDIEVVDQPGAYQALLPVLTDTPYKINPIGVTMNAEPLETWGKIAGTVTGRRCDGSVGPLRDATVQIDTWVRSFTLRTDPDGHFQLWLDWRHAPVTLIVAKDGWQPQFRFADIRALETTTANFTLRAVCT